MPLVVANKPMKLNAKQLRKTLPPLSSDRAGQTSVVLVLDNVQDTYNIGSFFRLADALGIGKIYLCGKTVAPPNPKIHRASVGLWRWISWEQHRDTAELLKKLKKRGFHIIAVEQDKKSVSYLDLKPSFPLALVVGHESFGVSKTALRQADVVVEIPLFGINRSLNVLVAASVVGYEIISFLSEGKKKQGCNN